MTVDTHRVTILLGVATITYICMPGYLSDRQVYTAKLADTVINCGTKTEQRHFVCV